jgi:hypothetical protein
VSVSATTLGAHFDPRPFRKYGAHTDLTFAHHYSC